MATKPFYIRIYANPTPVGSVSTALDAGYLYLPDPYLTGIYTTDGAEPTTDGSNWYKQATQTPFATNLKIAVLRDGFSTSYSGNSVPLYSLGYEPETYEWSETSLYFGIYGANYWYTYFNYIKGGFVSTDSRNLNQPDIYVLADANKTTYLAVEIMNSQGNPTGTFSIYRCNVTHPPVLLDNLPLPSNYGGDASEPDITDGNYDNSSDIIDLPNYKNINYQMGKLGFIQLYVVNDVALNNIGRMLWSKDIWDNFISSIYNPIDAMIAINLIPDSDDLQTSLPNRYQLYVGNMYMGVICPTLVNQFYNLDMGTLKISPYFGSALDYDPYTQIQIFMPFVGTVQVSADDVMGRTLHIVYTIDAVTGTIVANMTRSVDGGESVIGSYMGNCSISVPMTSNNWAQFQTAVVNATAGITSSLSSGISQGFGTTSTPAQYDQGFQVTKGTTSIKSLGAGSIIGGTVGSLATAANTVGSSKINYQRGGSVAMSAGIMGVPYCYAIINRPRQSLAKDYNTFVGYPSNLTRRLGDLHGFTSVEAINLENTNATAAEKSEIISLLKGGIIL